jgi:DNA replication protein DnaC
MIPMQRKILAFDGGPSAVISLRVLQKIEEQFPGFLERTDLFAGTSHGGIVSLKLAALLSAGVPASCAIDKCIEFDNEFLQLFKVTPTRVLRLLSGIKPMADSQGMLSFLKKHFTGPDGQLLTLGDLKKQVTISAFDLSIGKLRTYHAFEPGQTKNTTLLSVALACSSFPVLMPFFKPKDAKEPIIDGGFGANSGAMPALTDALLNMNEINKETRRGDLLPHVTLLSMGCISTDHPLRIPLFHPLADLAEWLGLFGKETDVNDEGTLRSVGWWFLLRNNVKVVLTLLENTQALDKRYAGNLLDHKRYHRMAPELEVLSLMWLLLTDPTAADIQFNALANKYWAAQMKQYKCWKAGARPRGNPTLRDANELACWLDWYWMQELDPAVTAAHPPISLRWDQYEVELRSTVLDPEKRLSTFDVSAQPGLPQRELAELGTCQFVKDARNVLIVGPTGAGKSHLAQALGNEAVIREHKVLYLPVARMLEQLAAARAAGTYDHKLAELAAVDLLILDDLGLKPMKDSGLGDFYDVVAERAGKKALIITSCIPPTEWAERMGDRMLADAILTRLGPGHHEFVLTRDSPSRDGTRREAVAQGRR